MSISYDAFLPDILPFARNCPDPTIEAAIRLSVIEMCERTEIWQAELDPISAVANQWAYDLEPPSGTVIHSIISFLNEKGEPLEAVSAPMLEYRYPGWREKPSNPKYYVKQDEDGQVWLAPAPALAKVNAYLMRVVLKPSITSTSASNIIMTDFRDCIINGAIARLLRMPDRDWSNYKTAAVHYAMFEQQLVEIEKRARKTNEGVVPVVSYGGIGAKPYERKRYTSGTRVR